MFTFISVNKLLMDKAITSVGAEYVLLSIFDDVLIPLVEKKCSVYFSFSNNTSAREIAFHRFVIKFFLWVLIIILFDTISKHVKK